ncbi:MAG: ABC transporter permease [Lachnospiraceae bacterium]|nr:ABC transporter permease [Lachnospiraceae bacterium]
MKKNLMKKMFRDLRNNATQFFSIFIMCLLSIFMLSAFDSDRQGYLSCTEEYYKATNFMDLCLLSEGFTQEDVNDLERIPEIKQVERRTSVVGKLTNVENKKIELNFIEGNEVCTLYTVQGEPYTEGKRGLWLDWYFAEKNGISVGDSLEIECNGKSFTEPVNGIVADSEHIYYIIDETFAETAYSEYCYAFLDASEYPFENITFEKALVDLVNVENQMYLDDTDRENLGKAKLKILDSISKSTLKIIMKNEQSGYQQIVTSCNFDKVMVSLFPPLFILLSVLCTITTMARLTAKQRTVIGTLKALGFSKWTIIVHYTMYSVVISASGCILGALLGYYIFGAWLFEDFEELYDSPIRHMDMSPLVPLVVLGVVLVTGMFNYLSCRKLLVLNASEILKPDAPKVSNAGRIEKTFIWKRLSFATRWNLRDININKGRSFMGIAGVALGSSLLMGSFGVMECFSMQEDWIYKNLRPADYTLILSGDSDYINAYDYACKYDGQMVMLSDVEISKGINNRVLNLTVTDEGNLYRFQDKNGNYVKVPAYGALLSTRAAVLLDAEVGDVIKFRIPTQKKNYSINVVGLYTTPDNQGILLSRNCYEKLGGYFEPTEIYTNMTVPKSYETTRSDVSGVLTKKEQVRAYQKANENNNEMIYITVVIAVVVGFVSSFNLGILSFMEKARDVATLKVLGFQANKIRWILQQQNLFITGIGSLAGIPFGLVYIKLLLDKIDPNGDYLVKLSEKPYILTIFFSFVVSVVVNAIISSKVNVINMVEALKGVE